VADWQIANAGPDIMAFWHCETDNGTNDRLVGLHSRKKKDGKTTSPAYRSLDRHALGMPMALKLGVQSRSAAHLAGRAAIIYFFLRSSIERHRVSEGRRTSQNRHPLT
jgi:hypothetical protein